MGKQLGGDENPTQLTWVLVVKPSLSNRIENPIRLLCIQSASLISSIVPISVPTMVSRANCQLRQNMGPIRRIAPDPEPVYTLTRRKSEELVAGILKEYDFDVKLSPVGPDGGIDVFAETDGESDSELHLVQCKRHCRDRRVGLPIIKQLNADHRDRRASRGLLVTASCLTNPALSCIEQAKYRLSGAASDILLEWLNRIWTNG